MSSYIATINMIREVCGKINITFSKEGDGRLTSAVKETEYLKLLEKGLKEIDPSIKFEHQPAHRHWWDLRVNGIPFDLKLTTGGRDNAINKKSILYTISGKEYSKNMNFNDFIKNISSCQKKSKRDTMTEYHYLVVNKNTGTILLKSMLDIHTFNTNPSNIIQINWKNEFKHIDYLTPDLDFNKKMKELLKLIQKSIKQKIKTIQDFANADIDTLFTENYVDTALEAFTKLNIKEEKPTEECEEESDEESDEEF